MDSIYNSYFFNDFYAQNGGGNYLNNDQWKPFFSSIANQIVERLHPKTVLDAGCAVGYLVEALRDCGVEAYGFDISEYAISKVREDIKPYCFVHSIQNPLPERFIQHYDLVLTIEVLEHLYPEAGIQAIQNLCNYADAIIFTSTPDDIDDCTHVNVRRKEYWSRAFADQSFYRDLVQPMDFICPWAELFVRRNDVPNIIHEYEMKLRLEKEVIEQEKTLSNTYFWNLFYDTGSGFDNNHILKGERIKAGENTSVTFRLPPETKAIRFDPVEGKFCVVKNLQIVTDNGVITPTNINGIKIDEFDIFETTDPQYVMDFGGRPTQWVKIQASIYLFQEMDLQILFAKFHQINILQEEKNKIQAEMQQLLLQKDEEIKTAQEEKNKIQAETQQLILQKDEEIKTAQEEKNKIQAETQQLILQKDEEIRISLLKRNQEFSIAKKREEELRHELDTYKENYLMVINQRTDLTNQLHNIEAMYSSISHSTFWEITKPLRLVIDFGKKLLKSSKIIKLFYKVLVTFKQRGFKFTIEKIRNNLNKRNKLNITAYKLVENMDEEQEAFQQQYCFENLIKMSLIVPTYKTKKEYLGDLINSVKNQTYTNWELCIADGNSNPDTVSELKKQCKNNSRIKTKFLKENKGIAGNTMEAYSLSSGDFVVLLDHDDFLSKDALFEIVKCINETPNVDFIYSDRAVFSDETNKILAYHYFPGYSPEYLKSCNDTSHLTAFSRRILDEVGFEREGYDGSQDYDLELRVTEKARKVVNIQKVLYFCRACEGSVALNPESKYYAYEAGRKAISQHIARIGYPGEVEFLKDTFSYRIRYDILERNKVSIIIPNKDHIDILHKCVESILQKTHYEDYEIIIVENNSTCSETFAYYDSLKSNSRISILYYPEKEFNFSAINNWAVERMEGNVVLLINNDVEVITENWLTEMLMYVQMSEVGAVGAILLYPNDTFQHTGLFIGLGGHIASTYDHGKNAIETGYMRRLIMPQNYSAVTAACLMVKKEDYINVGGLDYKDFKVGLNDVDFCLKLRELGKRNVVTPYAKLYHYEGVSRGNDEEGENQERFHDECDRFRKKWKKYFEYGDPYLNKNL